MDLFYNIDNAEDSNSLGMMGNIHNHRTATANSMAENFLDNVADCLLFFELLLCSRKESKLL